MTTQKTVTKIGKYDVIEILGKGGMGVVYKAMDNLIERVVAIKMMTGGFAENPDLLKRFYREADGFRLQPENPRLAPIYVSDVQICGKVTALIRPSVH